MSWRSASELKKLFASDERHVDFNLASRRSRLWNGTIQRRHYRCLRVAGAPLPNAGDVSTKIIEVV
jgi:hypothetical protein